MQVNGVGNISKDVTIVSEKLVTFSIACNKKDKEGKESVSFFEVKAIGFCAKIAKDFKVGDFVMVSGDLNQENWVDKDTQKKRYAIKILAFMCARINSKQSAATQTTDKQCRAVDEAPF